jgi:hypothetical protein
VLVKEIDHGLVLAAPTKGYVRTPGLHMSDLYGELFKQLDPKRFDKRDKDGNPEPMDLTKLELGTSFEEILEPVLIERLLGSRPGEFTTEDGVIFSPDQLFVEDSGELVLGELKLTWMSSRGAPMDEKFAKWICQMQAYCYHLDISRARLFALFVNGDYRPPSPKLLAWEFGFTKKELRDNWDTLVRIGRKKGLLPNPNTDTDSRSAKTVVTKKSTSTGK